MIRRARRAAGRACLAWLPIWLLAGLLACPASAQELGSTAMDRLMDRLGAVALALGSTSADLDRMYRLDKDYGRQDACSLLALSWAADAGHRTAHDSFLTLSALRVHPTMSREAYLFHMLQLRDAKARVDHAAKFMSDFDYLNVSEEDKPAVEPLRQELLELQAIFEELSAILSLDN